MNQLSTTSLMKISSTGDKFNRSFVIEPLAPGFGLTMGNALRRVLLSSLGGAAITSIRAEGASHEFSTITGVKQDMVDIILNLKKLRFKVEGDETLTAVVDVKGAKKITGADIKCPTGLSVINATEFIAESLINGHLLLELVVEKGVGYSPTEGRKDEKLPIGVIAIDASFSPVRRVNYTIENTRVGNMTNFDKLNIEIATDHSITAEAALMEAANILVEQFHQIVNPEVENTIPDTGDAAKELKASPKTAVKKEQEASPLDVPVKNSKKTSPKAATAKE